MSSNRVLFEYSLAFELWALKRCFLLPLMKLAPHGTDQLWHWMWGTQRISSLFIDTSCPNSSLASEWSNEGAGAAAECGAFLAGAGASQWSHHRIWNQVLRESKWERTVVWMAPDAIPGTVYWCWSLRYFLRPFQTSCLPFAVLNNHLHHLCFTITTKISTY